MATYGVALSQTPKAVSAQPMGFPLFKVARWENSKEFHLGPLCVPWLMCISEQIKAALKNFD